MSEETTTYYWKETGEDLTAEELDKYRDYPQLFDGDVGKK